MEGDGTPFDADTTERFLTAIRTKSPIRTQVDRRNLSEKAAAVIGSGGLLPPSGQGVVAPLYPNIGPTAVTDLLPTVAVDSPIIRYYTVSAGTAAVVAEGAPKPDANIVAAAKDVVLAKIAATCKVSDELSDDAPYLLAQVQASLIGAIVSKENEEVVSTLNTTSGILTKNGAATDAVDLVADGIASMQAVGTNPSALLVTPATLATIRKSKADSAGTYQVDPLSNGPTTLHGIPTYPVNVSGPNTAWLLDPTGLAYYRRSAVTFELGFDAEDWSHNLRTGRAESRGKAAVFQPLAVCKISLT